MRVLCIYTDCGPSYVRSGWGRVFEAMGHEFYFWRPNQKPAFDIFEELKPDLFIGTTYDLDRATLKCIERNPGMRVALYCSAWGKLADEIPEEYPITRAELMEKRMVAELWGKVKRPNFIFTHVGQKYKEDLLGGWKETGVPYHGILNAADTFMYMGGTRREELVCDVGFVGGYWPYKAKNLDRFMLPLCHPSAGLKVKIFGNQPWSVAQYLGMLKDEQTKDLFVSARVCPNVSEPHSTEFGYDIVERPFKVAAAGGFCISDYVEGMKEIFAEDEMPMFKTPGEFEDAIRFYVQNPELGQQIAERAKKRVLENHTYFHRVTEMFLGLGMADEATRCAKWYFHHVLGKEKPDES